jgi:cystathionine beta-lyase
VGYDARVSYDFDRLVDRRGTGSLKWDYSKKLAGIEGLLPLWVADMDFPVPPEILEAVEQRVHHGIFGYTLEPDSYFDALIAWLSRRHQWEVKREWIISAPGVVPSLSVAILACTAPGDGVIIQPPVYYPFANCIRNNGRRVVENPLVSIGSRYEMDFQGFERACDSGSRLLLLCSPHNPGSRVWDGATLARLSEICAARGIVIVSDEIHNDLVMEGHRHLPTAMASAHAARITITCISATKTFNLAGLLGSLVVIPDKELRERVQAVARGLWSGLSNVLSVTAFEAAYRHGEGWLEELLAYIRGNYDYTVSLLRARLPSIKVFSLEGTYLAWLDMRGLGLSDDEIIEKLRRQGGVWLDEGRKFGTGGEGFQRLNLACPRATLAEALDRIAGSLSF